LTQKGAVVVGVDTRRYFDAIRADAKPCDQLVGDAEMLSRQLQRRYPALQYTFPILAGAGSAGTLAYAILAQAPNNTLSGAVAIDPSPAVSGIPALCPGAPATTAAGGVVTYGPKADLQGFWQVGFDAKAGAADRAHVAELKTGGTPAEVTGVSGPDAVASLAGLIGPHLSQATSGGVDALPLVELPAVRPGAAMAVVMSGDGGWRDIDKVIAETLQEHGVSVVGWDCLRYFWRKKSPEQTADDLAAVLQTYIARWKPGKIALVGYSFGADVMPFLYDRLPPALRDKVVLVSLLGLESKADWEITVNGWLGKPPSDAATPIAPAVAKMPGSLIQCFYGEEEQDSACPQLASPGMDLIKTAGGHHFGHDYAAIVDRILAGLARHPAPADKVDAGPDTGHPTQE
jgi:type IV secretory pathway VirJ component